MSEIRKSEGFTLLVLEILIIIINTLAIIVIVRFKQKYNPDILIFTLAVADLLKALIPLNMTLVAYLKGNEMKEGSPSCTIFGWTAFTLNCGIMLVMTIMAIDRYVAMCMPFRYKEYLPKRRLIYIIIGVFVFSGAHSLLPLTGVGKMRSYSNGSFCHFDFDSTKPASMGYSIFILVLGFSMLVVVIFCYTRAMHSVKGLMRRQRGMSTSTNDIDGADKKRQQMNRMFARLMIVMMVAFCLSWLLFLIVVLQHVSGWFEIPPLAHFWSMRLAVVNSVLNPIIGAAMCKPYRRGYLFIIGACLRCCCGWRYNLKDPWKSARRLSACSRNGYERDQNEPGKSNKIRNVPSFTSYQDSGIVPDSNEYGGSYGYQQAGIVNATYELDNTPAIHHAKTLPRLTRKRISFKDEVVSERVTEMVIGGEAQNDTMGTVDSQQFSTASSADIERNLPPAGPDDDFQGTKNECSLKNTSDETHLIAMSVGTESAIQVSSNEKQRRNRDTSVGSKEKSTKDTSTNSLYNNERGTYSHGHMESMKEKTAENYRNSAKGSYQEQSRQHSPAHTIQITHFPVDTNSNINTATLKSSVLTDKQTSKSPSVFLAFSPRSSSFIERVRRISAPEHKPRSRSPIKDDDSLDATFSSCISKKTKPKSYDSTKKQCCTDLRTGALFDTRRNKVNEKLSLDLSPHLGKSRSFESVLNSNQCKLDESEFPGDLVVSPCRGHSYVDKIELSQGLSNYSYSESDLTYISSETVFLTENPSSRGHNKSRITGAQVDLKRYQSREQIPQTMLPSPDRVDKQLSHLNKEELDQEFFC
ncbi:uncharacterized protein LOC111335739 isoform X1 [Stylophora pistillata]|uniref:uncharacterized protein LOC111335739 isoform X1 n=1 Tax=Stylophora pistillata TaxID=50429 RepID=UPI000C042C59|nr:uncharacterized protein LOC111335739 isoform X1 [Stylophora pistillata]